MIFRFFLGALACASLLTGCNSRVSTPPVSQSQPEPTTQPTIVAGTPKPIEPRGATVRYAIILNRMRSADPQNRTIDRTMINDQNELGVVLDKNVAPDKVPEIMQTTLQKVAAEFPGDNVTLQVYAASDTTQPIGVAKLDGKTRGVTYAPVAK